MRTDGRDVAELRPITFERDYTDATAGSVLVYFGRTRVLCTASIDEDVPRWMRGKGEGWVTAEYSMLPGASSERIRREVKDGKPSGRTQAIQGLIGAHPITEHCGAISVGIVDGTPLLDLAYIEDSRAEVDMNVVMAGDRFV